MQTFLVILLIAAMLATVVALVRGIVAFLSNAHAEARGEGPSEASLKSNRMMIRRIQFQALAVVIIAIMFFAAGSGAGR